MENKEHINLPFIALGLSITALMVSLSGYFIVTSNSADKENSDNEREQTYTVEKNGEYNTTNYYTEEQLEELQIPTEYTTTNFEQNFTFKLEGSPIINEITFTEYAGEELEPLEIPGLEIIFSEKQVLYFVETTDVNRSIAAAGIQAQETFEPISILGEEKNFVVNLNGEGIPTGIENECVDAYLGETYIVHVVGKVHAFFEFEASNECDQGEVIQMLEIMHNSTETKTLLNIISSIQI